MLQHFRSSPLWLIGLFIIFAQGTAGVAAVQITGWPQAALELFVIAYSSSVTIVFFLFLWLRPSNFYAPSEYDKISPESFRRGLGQIPNEAAAVVAKAESNPTDDKALFALIDNLLAEDVKQHLVLMRKQKGEMRIGTVDNYGFSHKYEIVLRDKRVSFGKFSPAKFLSHLEGTSFVSRSDDSMKIFLTERGKNFANWLVKNKKDAETFNSDIGRWGKQQSAHEVLKTMITQSSQGSPPKISTHKSSN